MPDERAARTKAVEEFLSRYFGDEDADELRSLEEYQAAFPGYEADVAAAWSELQAEDDSTALERIGPFQLVREIGRGGQSIVFLATDTRVGREVAVKLLSAAQWVWTDTMLRRFRREAEIAGRLQHPGICPIYEADVENGVPYIVMPCLQGRTLAQILRDGRPERDLLLTWIHEIATTIDVAHAAGIVHRDLKPSNVLVTDDGRVVVMDFGIARDDTGSGATLTGAGDLVGTLPYMAPEQVQGEVVDARTDVYSLGVTLYECLSGRLPFDEQTQRATMNAIVRDDPPDLLRLDAGIGRDLDVIVQTALAKDKSRRFKSMRELAEEIARVREGRPIRSRPVGPLVRLAAWRRRNPAVALSVGAVFVVLVAGLATSLVLLSNVERERHQKQLALDEIDQLTDLTLLENLVAEIASFEPPRPESAEAMRTWLERADAVAARAPAQRTMLAELRARSLPYGDRERDADWSRNALMPEYRRLQRSAAYLEERITELEADAETDPRVLDHRKRELTTIKRVYTAFTKRLGGKRSYAFATPREQWRHDLQAKLVGALDDFLADTSFEQTRARVRKLLAFAERAERERHADAWRACRARIAATERYGRLDLPPQFALVPLGPDPASGLEEFVDLQTGTPPARDPQTGRLRVGEETGVVFVLLPGGRTRIGAIAPSIMRPEGSPHVDPLARSVEGPVHDVELEPFFLSKFEMTQAQWLRVTGTNPSQTRIGASFGGQPVVTAAHPVEGLSWNDTNAVLTSLGFDLPTSSQWEYAARAGTTTVFPTGNDPRSLQGFANIADLSYTRIGRRRATKELRILRDGWASHAPVGSFRPNAFGLHDMIGNVQEWCRDKDHRYAFHALPGDAMRVLGGTFGRVIRGASFLMVWSHARVASFHPLRRTLIRQDAGARPIRRVEERK